MRKWILKLLFGADIERFYKSLETASECYECFTKAHDLNTRLIQDYKELSDTYLEILNIASEVEDIEDFRWKAVELLKAKDLEKHEKVITTAVPTVLPPWIISL